MSGPILLVPMPGEESSAAALLPGVEWAFSSECRLSEARLDVTPAFDSFRGQYRSTVVLDLLQPVSSGASRILGVTSVDLFVPVLTFVFGEAQLNGPCAVVSSWRLREELYGLPPDAALERARLLKEAIHELGHTFGLRHCDDWTCAMHSSHAVERLDLKTAAFCERCHLRLTATAGAGLASGGRGGEASSIR